MRPASHSLTAMTDAAEWAGPLLSARITGLRRLATSPPWAVTTQGVCRSRPAAAAMRPVGNR